MVMRQNYKSESYFESQLNWLKRDVIEEGERLLDQELSEPKRIFLEESIAESYMEELILKYTMGYPVDDLEFIHKRVVQHTLNRIELSPTSLAPEENLEQYLSCLWILSFSFFFNTPSEQVARIVDCIPFSGDDWLMDLLAKASVSGHPVNSRQLKFPDAYQPLMDALKCVHEPISFKGNMHDFCNNYYKVLKKHDVSWHDSHKEDDPEYCSHFGYWMFELPALMISTNIYDDSVYRDNPMYPKDLADWKRTKLSF